MQTAKRDGKSANTTPRGGPRVTAQHSNQHAEQAAGKVSISKKTVSFADEMKKVPYSHGVDDPAAHHAYEDTPTNLCSLSLRIASKGVLQNAVISIFVLCYCGVLCWASPIPPVGSAQYLALRVVSCMSIVVWTLEIAAKMLGFGVCPFFRNKWNLLDGACLISLYMDVAAFPGISFAYFRLLKVARPLMHYKVFARAQRMIDAVCHSFTLLPPIISLTAIFTFLCAVLGTQLFGSSGVLYNRCVKPAELVDRAAAATNGQIIRSAKRAGTPSFGDAEILSQFGTATDRFILVLPEAHCSNGTGLSLGKYSCDATDGQVCKKMSDITPFDGLESFDNALSALIVVVLAILQQKYDHVFTGTTDAAGDIVGLYFLVITLAGVFFLLNLTTASLTLAYAQMRKGSTSNYMVCDHLSSPEPSPASLPGQFVSPGRGSSREAGGRASDAGAVTLSRRTDSNHSEGVEADTEWQKDREMDSMGSIVGGNAHSLLRGVVSARQFFEQCSEAMASQYQRSGEFIARSWSPCVRPFAVIVSYPNYVEIGADLCSTSFRVTPYSEILLRLASVAHTAVLASVSYRSAQEDVAIFQSVDVSFICFFALVESLRVCAYAGVWRYISKSWTHASDFFISVATTIIWFAGASDRFQMGPLRVMRLSVLIWDLRMFRRARHVLLVSFGQTSELPLAMAAVLLFYIICAFLLFQIFHRVELDNERQMFQTFPSSLISLLEMTAGDSLRQLIMQAYKDLGVHAVIIVVVLCFLVKHVINKILTAVVLHNLSTPDPDKVWYQLQFERLSWLYGWTASEKAYHWLHTRDHSELLRHGEKQILIPDIAGVFERVSADDTLFDAHGGHSVQEDFPPANKGVIDGAVSILHNMNASAHKTLNLDLKYNLNIRVVKCSDFKVEGLFHDRSAVRVRLELCDFYAEAEDLQVVSSSLSGPPLAGADTRWEEDFKFEQISNKAVLKITVVNEGQTGEIFLGQTSLNVRSFTSEVETIRSLHLMDAKGVVLGMDCVPGEGSNVDDAAKLITLHLKSELDHAPSSLPARIRLRLKQILHSDAFELFIFCLIILCIILSIIEFELRGHRLLHRVVDVVFLSIFSTEAFLKILGFGLWHEPDAYFRSGWNIFDCIITVWMSIAFALDGSDTLNVYALRFFRVLRPLLHMQRFQGFQIAVRALYRSGSVLFLILVTQLACLLAVSVSCLWAFRGSIHTCNDPDLEGEWDCLSFFEQDDGFLLPRSWTSPQDSFDSIVEAFLACYRTLNRSGWLKVVEEVMSSGDVDRSRPTFRSEAHALPFLAIEFSCNLILFQTMMSIMINAIDVTRGQALMTSAQKTFESSVFLIVRAKHEFVKFVQQEGIQWLQEVVLHNYFEAMTTIVILINIIVLLFESYSAPPSQREFLHTANIIFVYFYAVEQLLKITAFSWAYFVPKINGNRCLSYTNIFDFTVSLASFLEITVLTGTGTGINLLRSFRALRLLNTINSIKQILVAASSSAATVLGCFGLFMVFIVAFAVMGVPVFHDVKRGMSLSRVTNFDTVKAGIVVLTRTAAGEDWPALMYELSLQPPYCHMPPDQSWIEYYADKLKSPGHSRGDCGSNFAYPFFCLFSFLCKFAFIPLFSASMVSIFLQHVGQQASVNDCDVALYTKVWGQLDKKCTGTLPAWKLKHLIDRLHAEGSVLAFDTIRKPQRLEKARKALEMRSAKSGCHVSAEGLAAQKVIRRPEAVAFTVNDSSHASKEGAKSGLRTLFKSKLVITFEDVLIILVCMQFFESAVPDYHSGADDSWLDVVRLWSRDSNAKAARIAWLRQSGADLPVQGYRLHTWVHTCSMVSALRHIPLFVRVTVQESGGAISGDTRTVSSFSRTKTNSQSADAEEATDAVAHVWEQDVVLDFNGHEDTVLTFEIYNGKSEALVGRCSERLRDLSYEHLACRTMEIFHGKDRDVAMETSHKRKSLGLLSMTCCFIAPLGEDGVIGRSADTAKGDTARLQGWVLMGQGPAQLQRAARKEDLQKADDSSSIESSSDVGAYEAASSLPGANQRDSDRLSALASYQEAMQNQKGLMSLWTSDAASQVRSMLGLKPDEAAERRARKLENEYIRRNYQFSDVSRDAGWSLGAGAASATLKQHALKSGMKQRREKERRKIAQKVMTADRSSRVPHLKLHAEAKWREANEGRVAAKPEVAPGHLGTLMGFLTPRSAPDTLSEDQGEHAMTPSHWLTKSTPRRLSQRYSRSGATSQPLHESRGVNVRVGLQMLEAQGNSISCRGIASPRRRLWLSDEADANQGKPEVAWWLASAGHTEQGYVAAAPAEDGAWTSETDSDSTPTTEATVSYDPDDVPQEPLPWEKVASTSQHNQQYLAPKASPRNWEMSWDAVRSGPATIMSRRSAASESASVNGGNVSLLAAGEGPRKLSSQDQGASSADSDRGTDDSECNDSGTATPPGSPSNGSPRKSDIGDVESVGPRASTSLGITAALGLRGGGSLVDGAKQDTMSSPGQAVYISGGPVTQGPRPMRFSADGLLWMAESLLTPRGGWVGARGGQEGTSGGRERGETKTAQASVACEPSMPSMPSMPDARSQGRREATSSEKPITFSPARRSQGLPRPKKVREGEREKLTGRRGMG